MDIITAEAKKIDNLTEEEAKKVLKNLVKFIVEHEQEYNKEFSKPAEKLISIGLQLDGRGFPKI